MVALQKGGQRLVNLYFCIWCVHFAGELCEQHRGVRPCCWPVTSLARKREQNVFWEGPIFFKQRLTLFSRESEKFCMRPLAPLLVTGMPRWASSRLDEPDVSYLLVCFCKSQQWLLSSVASFREQDSHAVLKVLKKVLNFNDFQDLAKVLKLAKACIKYWKCKEILNGEDIWSTWAEFYWR